MDGSGRFSECVKKWTTAKPDAQHDVFFILVTGAPTHPNLTCSPHPRWLIISFSLSHNSWTSLTLTSSTKTLKMPRPRAARFISPNMRSLSQCVSRTKLFWTWGGSSSRPVNLYCHIGIGSWSAYSTYLYLDFYLSAYKEKWHSRVIC